MKNINTQLDSDEMLVYNIIRRETENHGGVFQTKLKELNELKHLEPQKIARIVLKLAKQGLIKRELVSNNGRSMYFLQAISVQVREEKKDSDYYMIKLDSVIEIPCFTCKELERCSEGSFPAPSKCPLLTRYIMSKLGKSSRTF